MKSVEAAGEWMKFWDSSALVPLLLDESQSESMIRLLREDPDLVTWWGTSIECVSAVRRREREGILSAESTRDALEFLRTLTDEWTEVLPSTRLKFHASRLMATHPLRAADSIQLAAAIAWRADPTSRPEFVCLDDRLTDAASREGFSCIPA